MQELKEFMEVAQPDETMLVLSATMSYEDMYTHYSLFSLLNMDKFIFTKFDETKKIGNAVNLLLTSSRSVAYVTNGQNVPDDIVVPDKSSLILSILAEEV
jgi:flagellar biosynthesis protein FlhF